MDHTRAHTLQSTHRALRDLHRPTPEHDHRVCFECGLPWPCRTRTALDQSAPTLADCPHCTPHHQPPWSGTWSVHLAPHPDSDNQPTTLHLSRPDGAHASEYDAHWVSDVLNAASHDHHRAPDELSDDERTARIRANTTRTVHHLDALDLHQALDLPLDPHSKYQGHPSPSHWWAHLLHQVRTQHNPPRPPRGTAT